jgi:hypothetical protein
MFAGYVIMSYKKLMRQNEVLEKLDTEIKTDYSDTIRREHNAIARNYNHTLNGFIGKLLAKRLKYVEKEIIEKI